MVSGDLGSGDILKSHTIGNAANGAIPGVCYVDPTSPAMYNEIGGFVKLCSAGVPIIVARCAVSCGCGCGPYALDGSRVRLTGPGPGKEDFEHLILRVRRQGKLQHKQLE